MESKSLDSWQRLTCSCGTERFAKVMHLRWRAGSGMTEEPAGYFCLECHGTVDASALIAKAQLKAKEQELKELQDELAPPPTPAKKETAGAAK